MRNLALESVRLDDRLEKALNVSNLHDMILAGTLLRPHILPSGKSRDRRNRIAKSWIQSPRSYLQDLKFVQLSFE